MSNLETAMAMTVDIGTMSLPRSVKRLTGLLVSVATLLPIDTDAVSGSNPFSCFCWASWKGEWVALSNVAVNVEIRKW